MVKASSVDCYWSGLGGATKHRNNNNESSYKNEVKSSFKEILISTNMAMSNKTN